MLSPDYGKHLMGVDDLLQKHSLLESDIRVIGDRVKAINAQAAKFVDCDFPDVPGCYSEFLKLINKSLFQFFMHCDRQMNISNHYCANIVVKFYLMVCYDSRH